VFLLIHGHHLTLVVEDNEAVAGGSQIQGTHGFRHGGSPLRIDSGG
jgi:hypothetical protein